MHSQKGTTCEILLPNKQSINVPQTMQTYADTTWIRVLRNIVLPESPQWKRSTESRVRQGHLEGWLPRLRRRLTRWGSNETFQVLSTTTKYYIIIYIKLSNLILGQLGYLHSPSWFSNQQVWGQLGTNYRYTMIHQIENLPWSYKVPFWDRQTERQNILSGMSRLSLFDACD